MTETLPSVLQLDPRDPEAVRGAAELHCALLPESPVPRLGMRFMTRFYYTDLVRDGLIGCILAVHEKQYAGFVAYTMAPYTFMPEGKRRHLLRVLYLLGLAILEKPSRLGVLWEVSRAGKRRRHDQDGPSAGEILSFGVLPPYRQQIDPITGLRFSHLLFQQTAAKLREEGLTHMFLLVDAENTRAHDFYLKYPGTVAPATFAHLANHNLISYDLAGLELTVRGDGSPLDR